MGRATPCLELCLVKTDPGCSCTLQAATGNGNTNMTHMLPRRLRFEANGDISGMLSVEGELVPLKSRIRPADANGTVEKWLVQVGPAALCVCCRRGRRRLGAACCWVLSSCRQSDC